MKFLKFLFTTRMSFVLLAFLAFVATMLYLGWVHRHLTPVLMHAGRAGQTR
jgi:hypothetical protein